MCQSLSLARNEDELKGSSFASQASALTLANEEQRQQRQELSWETHAVLRV